MNQYRTLEDDLRDAAYAAQYRNVYEGDDPKNAVPCDRFRWDHRPAEAGQEICEAKQKEVASMTVKEKVEKLWRKSRQEGWDYKKYCDRYHALIRGEEEKDD